MRSLILHLRRLVQSWENERSGLGHLCDSPGYETGCFEAKKIGDDRNGLGYATDHVVESEISRAASRQYD